MLYRGNFKTRVLISVDSYHQGSFTDRLIIVAACVISLSVIIGATFLWAKYTLFERFDTLIVNGAVVDGTGASARIEAIGIKGGRFVPVEWPSFATANSTIDAQGLFVSPGFIDVHTHIEVNVDDSTRRGAPLYAPNFLAQGITTIITGNCGRSALPLSQFFDELESRGTQVNVGSLVGHNTIRRKVMGEEPRKSSEVDQQQMYVILKQAMRDGALGFSTGLEYTPGAFASSDEIALLADIVSRYHGIYATHLRDEGNDLDQSVEEALSVAEKANIPVQISHLKVRGKTNWGRSPYLVDKIERARQSGLKVKCDIYPYTASSTSLEILVPKQAREGGVRKLRERLNNPSERSLIIDGILSQMRAEGWHNFQFARVAYCEFAPQYNGLSIPEIAVRLKADPIANSESVSSISQESVEKRDDEENESGSHNKVSANVREQAEAICHLLKRGYVQMIYENMSEEDVINILRFSDCMLGSDSGIRTGDGQPHPRGFGSAPRLIARFVRELGVIAIEEAIRRMTSLPADTFGIKERGRIAPGYWADVVIFDPEAIRDKADYKDPFNPPEGIYQVLINGELVLDRGRTLPLNPGQVIRRAN